MAVGVKAVVVVSLLLPMSFMRVVGVVLRV
jgi:hypothetical protein